MMKNLDVKTGQKLNEIHLGLIGLMYDMNILLTIALLTFPRFRKFMMITDMKNVPSAKNNKDRISVRHD